MTRQAFVSMVSSVLIFLCAAGPVYGENEYHFDIVATEPLGVVYLLETLRGDPHRTAHIKEVFYAARGKDEEDSRLLGEYRDLIDGRWGAIILPGDAHKERRLENVLEAMAASSSTGHEFLDKTRALLNTRDFDIFCRVYGHFEKSYHTIIWMPCNPDFDRQFRSLREQVAEVKIGDCLTQMGRLFESAWPCSQTFVVALTPVPREREAHFSMFAHSDGYLEVVEAATGEEIAHAMGVFFHEICHSLWYLRSEKTREKVRAFFMESDGRYAYGEFNESLATALGNGWVGRMLAKDPETKQWYNDPYIDGYARALLPLLLSYMKEEKVIDRTFCQEATAVFKRTFPGADRIPHLIMREILVLSNSPQADTTAWHYRLAGTGIVRSACSAVPLEEKRSLEKFGELSPMTAVFFITPDEVETLRHYPFTREEIERIKASVKGDLPALWWKKEGSRWIFLCVGSTWEAQEKAFNDILSRETLPDQTSQ